MWRHTLTRIVDCLCCARLPHCAGESSRRLRRHTLSLACAACPSLSAHLSACIRISFSMSAPPASGESAAACDRPAKDLSGHWLCLAPGCTSTRITAPRDARTFGKGRAHRACLLRVQRAEAKAKPAAVLHSGSSPAAAAASAATPTAAAAQEKFARASISDTTQRLSAFFASFGHVCAPSTEASRTLAWQVLQCSLRSNREVIAGKVRQIDFSRITDSIEAAESMLTEWSRLVKQVAALLGLHAENMFVVDSKLLVATPKQGKQAVHWDMSRGESTRHECCRASPFMCSHCACRYC